jgi:glucosamine--fructose-6-phosphate aminotransferase (isomerizing)
MCGIVGYIGNGNTKDMLIDSLGMLEYRGYDSAGIALAGLDELKIIKTCDRVAKLREIVPATFFASSGIGHTRWATHGKPSDINAHPHRDCTGLIAVVHNGIIENYQELKDMLTARGHLFISETDSEVVSHLVEEFYQGDMKTALVETVKRLQGSFALVVVNENVPDKLFAVKKDSPLTIGISDGQCFVASDMMAFLKYTRRVLFLKDGDIATITKDTVEVCDFAGTSVVRVPKYIDWNLKDIGKSGYDHYMLKEIHEQPVSLTDAMASRLNEKTGEVSLNELTLTPGQIRDVKRVIIVACGTSYHAGLIGKYAFERLTDLSLNVEIGSEFRYALGHLGPETLVIAISQSGETADTLAAVKEAVHKGSHVIAITNSYGSSITREASDTLYMQAGPEIGVAATKTFTTQVLLLYMLALYIGQARCVISPDEMRKFISSILALPQKVQRVFDQEPYIDEITRLFTKSDSLFFIGRNMDYPVALEGSLKLKEIAYVFSEGFAAGELKHGPIALITSKVPVIAITTRSNTYDKTVSNIKEIMARDATVIAVASESDETIGQLTDLVVRVPDACEYTSPVLSSIVLQLFSYYMALHRGCPIDRPRNLAKSVTVE